MRGTAPVRLQSTLIGLIQCLFSGVTRGRRVKSSPIPRMTSLNDAISSLKYSNQLKPVLDVKSKKLSRIRCNLD